MKNQAWKFINGNNWHLPYDGKDKLARVGASLWRQHLGHRPLNICHEGIHWCYQLRDAFEFAATTKLALVEPLGSIQAHHEDPKWCSDGVKILKKADIKLLIRRYLIKRCKITSKSPKAFRDLLRVFTSGQAREARFEQYIERTYIYTPGNTHWESADALRDLINYYWAPQTPLNGAFTPKEQTELANLIKRHFKTI